MTMKFSKELIGPQCRLSSHTCSLLGEAARSTGEIEIRKSPPRWRTTLAWDIEGRGETKLTVSRGASHWTNRKILFAQWTLRSQSVFRTHWNEKPVVWNSSAFWKTAPFSWRISVDFRTNKRNKAVFKFFRCFYSFYIVAVRRTAKKWVEKKTFTIHVIRWRSEALYFTVNAAPERKLNHLLIRIADCPSKTYNVNCTC